MNKRIASKLIFILITLACCILAYGSFVIHEMATDHASKWTAINAKARSALTLYLGDEITRADATHILKSVNSEIALLQASVPTNKNRMLMIVSAMIALTGVIFAVALALALRTHSGIKEDLLEIKEEWLEVLQYFKVKFEFKR